MGAVLNHLNLQQQNIGTYLGKFARGGGVPKLMRILHIFCLYLAKGQTDSSFTCPCHGQSALNRRGWFYR
ncbi:hypothetical protein C7K08_11880 [Synechococcus lacustris str. Tous]|uniref:Uncharacterized protein n=1 Tax=Synechococcus lacustris str. Tous TaxID=1910958 RepID=A0A2P7EBT6_9SYNE|nr:hypothetical protein C7K08_11880 [Synechococcus lacustris str. Tous]